MILKIHDGMNVLLISHVFYACTYQSGKGNYVEILRDGEQSLEPWLLTGPSYLLNDDGNVLSELPYGDIDERKLRAEQSGKKEPRAIEPGISVNFTGSYVCPEDLDVRKTILEAVNDVLRKKGGERWCLR